MTNTEIALRLMVKPASFPSALADDVFLWIRRAAPGAGVWWDSEEACWSVWSSGPESVLVEESVEDEFGRSVAIARFDD